MNIKSVQSVSNYLKVMEQYKDARMTKDPSRLASIRNSLMLGKKLSTEELNYLQRHDPHLHHQAMNLSVERQAYENALRYSRSKQGAKDYNTFRLMQIAGQLKHHRGGSEELLMRANTIQEAHREFVRSSKYATLRSDG